MSIYADYTPPGLDEEPAVPLKGLVDDLFIFLTDNKFLILYSKVN